MALGVYGRGNTGLVYELDKEVIGGMNSGLVGGFIIRFHVPLKARLQGICKQLGLLDWPCD